MAKRWKLVAVEPSEWRIEGASVSREYGAWIVRVHGLIVGERYRLPGAKWLAESHLAVVFAKEVAS